MSTNFYARTSSLSGKLRTRLAALAAGLLLVPAAWAQQVDVPVGNPNDASGRRPLGTFFGYERSAMIYTAEEIGASGSGNVTQVGFYLNTVNTPGAAPTKIYLKTVSNATFAAATTVAAEQMGATLVYDSTIPAASFTANSWVTVPLTTPFAYNGTSNLEVIVETNATGDGNETGAGKVFRYSSTGTGVNRAQFWAMDGTAPTLTGLLSVTRPNIRLVGLTPIANDAAVRAVFTLGKALVATPQVVQAVVTNRGSAALTNLPVTLNVTGATTFTDAKVVASLASGATATVTFAPYTPTAVGSNVVAVTIPADGQNANNSKSYPQVVTANSLSYLDDSQPVTAGVGVNPTVPGGTLAVKFVTSAAAPIADVKLSFLASTITTTTYQVVVLNATPAGLPNAVVFTSPTLSRPTTTGVVTVPVTGTTVNGTFFVGLKEVSGNVAIGYQVEDPLRPATFYFQTTSTGAWTDVNTTPLRVRLGIEVTLNRPLATNSPALSKSISMFPNPSNGQVTLDIRDAKAKGAMQVQVTNMLGQIVQTVAVRDNAENKLNLSGLADGMYVLRVSSGAEYTIRQLVLTK